MGAHGGPRGEMTTGVANNATERRRAPGWRPGPEGRQGAAGLSGVALRAGLRLDRVAAALGPDWLGRPGRALRLGRLALRSAAVYWFQWGLHIRPRPDFWLGWAGNSVTGASCATIPSVVELTPVDMARSAQPNLPLPSGRPAPRSARTSSPRDGRRWRSSSDESCRSRSIIGSRSGRQSVSARGRPRESSWAGRCAKRGLVHRHRGERRDDRAATPIQKVWATARLNASWIPVTTPSMNGARPPAPAPGWPPGSPPRDRRRRSAS